jgi:hypothetical protein
MPSKSRWSRVRSERMVEAVAGGRAERHGAGLAEPPVAVEPFVDRGVDRHVERPGEKAR